MDFQQSLFSGLFDDAFIKRPFKIARKKREDINIASSYALTLLFCVLFALLLLLL